MTDDDRDSAALDEVDLLDVDPDDIDDVNEWAVAEWVETTTAAERVHTTLRHTREPQTASEIADRARVSTPAARDHLNRLAGMGGPAVAIEAGGSKRYLRDPDQERFDRIKTIADGHSRSELEAAIREMKTDVRAYEDTYEVTSPEELARVLDPDDDAGWEAVSTWKTVRKNLTFAKTALAFMETRAIDAMDEGVADGGAVLSPEDG